MKKTLIAAITIMAVIAFSVSGITHAGQTSALLQKPGSGGSDTITIYSNNVNFTNATIRLPGLLDPVTITIDQSGTAHIRALNNHDLFFAQGYYTARERLFQMELEALSVSGNFSRYIGPAGLSSDISARLQQIPQRAYSLDQLYKREYPQYYAYLKDYANGVNAYINQTINSPPLCFEIYGFSPVYWRVLYTLDWQENMAFGLINGKGNSIRNDLFINAFGVNNTSLLWPDYPYFTQNITVVPGSGTVNGYNLTDQGISPSYLWSLNWYSRFATGVNLSLIKNLTSLLCTANANDPYLNLFKHNIDRSYAGSNEWIVTGNYSATGYPMIENDPHLGLSLPNLFLPMQLTDPFFNVTGWELVNVPGILIGHTPYTSWGLTTPGGYNANEYLEILNGSNYLYNGTWHPIDVCKYVLLGHTYYVNYTNNGPLWAQTNNFGISFNWAGDVNSLDFIALVKLDQSTNYSSMLNALRYWASPPQNFALVSRSSAGIITAGDFPLIDTTLPDGKTVKVIGSQSLLNGSLPRYEPDGIVPFKYLPQVKNPARGYAFAPNQPLAGLNYPYPLVAESGGQGGRAHTISAFLAAHPNMTVNDMIALQANVSAPFAVMLVPLLISALRNMSMNTTETEAFHYLQSWNYTDYTNEVGPTVYWYLKMEVVNMSFQRIYSQNGFNAEGIPTVSTLIYLAENHMNSAWLNGNFTELVREAFPAAVSFLLKNIGPNVSSWQWGVVHQLEIPNLAGLPQGNFGPIPYKGGSHTVSVAGVGSIDFSVPMSPATTSSVLKEISSPGTGTFLGVTPGGPSESPLSDYYTTQLHYWLEDKYYNMSNQPTIFTISLNPENFTVVFREKGLASGTQWSVILDNVTNTSDTTTLTFSMPNGTYFYYVENVPGYVMTPFSGSLTVQGNVTYVNVTFSQLTYSLTFVENGLPSNSTWVVSLKDMSNPQNIIGQKESHSSTITYNVTSGTYVYSAHVLNNTNESSSVAKFYPAYSNGTIVVTANQNVSIYFYQEPKLVAPNHQQALYLTIFEALTGILLVIAVAESVILMRNRNNRKKE